MAVPGPPEAGRSLAQVQLMLVRHGQTTSNLTGALDTAAPGAHLTTLGAAQAAVIPDALRGVPIAAVYCSARIRTQLTAAPLTADRALVTQVRDGLEEISAGDLEMSPDPEARTMYLACVAAWMAGDLDRALPGATDGHAFLDRMDDALRRIAAENSGDDRVIVFGHGAAIRTYTSLRTAAFTPEQIAESRIANTGSALLTGDPDTGWHLTRWSPDPLGGALLDDHQPHDVTGTNKAASAH